VSFLRALLPRIVDPIMAKEEADAQIAHVACCGVLTMPSEDLHLIGCELGQVRAEFNEYKKAGEHRQVAQRRRIATMIKAVQDAGGIQALKSRWPQGNLCASVVNSRAFFYFFPCNHIIKIKNKFLFPAKQKTA